MLTGGSLPPPLMLTSMVSSKLKRLVCTQNSHFFVYCLLTFSTATKALASGTVATVTLAPNELQLYSIPAKENAGGAVKVVTSDAVNTTEIYVANTIPTPTTTKPYYL